MFVSVEEPTSEQSPLRQQVLNSGHLETHSPLGVFTDDNETPEQGKEPTISELQEEVLALRLKLRSLDVKRSESLNKILDIKGSIRVFCRVRSSSPWEKGRNQAQISIGSDKIAVESAGGRKEFCLDKVFPPESTQEDVFVEVEPILRSALDGHNVCVFAYGQTGTGKTYTMEGLVNKPGIVPRAIKEIFQQANQDEAASSFTFSISMLEVYMGSLRDLLAQKLHSSKAMTFTTKRNPLVVYDNNLNIQASGSGVVEVEGLTDVSVDDFKQAYKWYVKGRRARSTSWTHVNEASSRSHCLTRITIAKASNNEESRKVIGKLWMVDLGGSERLLKTGATGQTMDEGKAINLSLSTLGDVISALKRRRHHVPYRNSKLTQILSDSLGDGSKVLMLVHISPSEDDVGETVCSLNFAKRARASEFSKELSDDLKKQKECHIMELNEKIKDTEIEIERVRRQIQITESIIYQRKRLHEDQKGSPRSPLTMDNEDTTDSPRSAEKTISSKTQSLPRFMASTFCSRQRKSTSLEIGSRVKTQRSRIQNSIDLLGSQSRSLSDPYSKINHQNLRTKALKCQSNKIRELSCLSVNASCNIAVSKSSPMMQNGNVSTSQPSLRLTMSHHTRRMSNPT